MKYYKFNRDAADIDDARLDATWRVCADVFGDPRSSMWSGGSAGLWHPDVLKHGILKRAGYVFVLFDVLTRYLVNDGDHIGIYYAPSKTALRYGGTWSNANRIQIADCPSNF